MSSRGKAQVESVIRKLEGQYPLDHLRAGITGACGDVVLHAVQRDKPPQPTVEALCPNIYGLTSVIYTVCDEVDVVAIRILAEVGRIAAAGQHSERDTMPLGGLHPVQLVRLTVLRLCRP